VERIGFIGVGSMGSRMARRLQRAGHRLTVCDRDPTALRAFEALGTPVGTLPSACAASDVVILMVANDGQLRDVVLAPDGLLSAIDAAAPPLVAVMSTVLPQTIHEIAEPLLRSKVALVDAPVSGGLAGADAGTLTIMIGGAEENVARLRPILQELASTVFHCGKLGSGQLTKIVNNMVGVTNLFLAAEAMTLARRHGLDPDLLVSIMEASSGRTAYTRDWNGRKATYSAIASSATRMQSHLAICRKDLRCASTLAQDAHVRLGVLESIEAAVATSNDSELQRIWQEAFS
jgi:3-hydroxyisobutyrate dehydrogenase